MGSEDILFDFRHALCNSVSNSVDLRVIRYYLYKFTLSIFSPNLLLIVFISHFSLFSSSQEVNISEIISSIAEELAADENDDASAGIFTEMLNELADDPVIINSADESEAGRLFFLTPFQVKAITDYVKTSGRIVSPYEIAVIPGFDRETVETIIPFITLADGSPGSSMPTASKNTLLSSFIIKPGTTDAGNLGSPWRILTRYKFTSGRFSGGFTAEKDPGESLLQAGKGLPDFFSSNMAYTGTGFIKKIIIGDFSARFGQGTNINTGLKTGLSLTTPGYLAGTSEMKPYTSTDENNYFRGAAILMAIRSLDVSLFVSRNRIDATLNDKTDPAASAISSLYKTGYHNTPSALQKKDIVAENSYGINLSYNFRSLRAGLTITENRFTIPFEGPAADPADLFKFSGIRNSLFSFYYSSSLKRTIMFGEVTAGGKEKYSFIQGISMRPADRLNINLFIRRTSPGFVSIHGKLPGVGSGTYNESGIYGNFTFEAARYLFISAGSDIRSFPWLRYRCHSPSFSRREEIRIKYIPSERLTLEGVFNNRYSETDDNTDTGIPSRLGNSSKAVRLSVKYSPADNLVTGTRFDHKIVSQTGNSGFLLLQDINIKLVRIPLSIWMRFCIYETAGFETGIYTWENDLLNGFSIPVMYGSGNRNYIMISCKANGKTEIRLKYAITSRETEGISYSFPEVKIQFRLVL